MEHQVYCPHCNRIVNVAAGMEGQITTCPTCQGRFRVPEGISSNSPSFENPYGPGQAPPGSFMASQDSHLKETVGIARISCGLLAIFGAWAGLHKFAMGRTVPGLIMLLTTLLSCFLLAPVMWIIGIVEGIIYLVQDDEEFFQRYVVQKRGWF